MSTLEHEAGNRADEPRRPIIVCALVLAVVFFIGLIPMWLVALGRAAERDAAQHQLRLCRLENILSSVAVESAGASMSVRVRRLVAFSLHCKNWWMANGRI